MNLYRALAALKRELDLRTSLKQPYLHPAAESYKMTTKLSRWTTSS
jgi:hypothetical protein